MLSKATRRYSLALYEAAVSEKKLNKVAEDCINLIDLIKSNRDLNLFFSSPVIREEKKIQIVEKLFDKKINKLTIDFIKLIITNNRGMLVSDIFNGFLELKNEAEGKVKAEVKTAIKISDKEKKKLKEKLDGFTRMDSIPEFYIDESLMGGFTIKVKDEVIDASIKRQLENLRNRFKGINIKQN